MKFCLKNKVHEIDIFVELGIYMKSIGQYYVEMVYQFFFFFKPINNVELL